MSEFREILQYRDKALAEKEDHISKIGSENSRLKYDIRYYKELLEEERKINRKHSVREMATIIETVMKLLQQKDPNANLLDFMMSFPEQPESLLSKKVFNRDSENYYSVIKYCREVNTTFHNDMADIIDTLLEKWHTTIWDNLRQEDQISKMKKLINKLMKERQQHEQSSAKLQP